MTGAQVRQVRAEGLGLGTARITVIPDAPCCNTLYIRGDLAEAFLAAVTKRLKTQRHKQEAL
jgi:hypothetical protein